MTQKIRIRLKAYDHMVLDRSAAEIVRTAERTGARPNEVSLRLAEPESVGCGRVDGEVVHGVVEDDPGARDENARAKT